MKRRLTLVALAVLLALFAHLAVRGAHQGDVRPLGRGASQRATDASDSLLTRSHRI